MSRPKPGQGGEKATGGYGPPQIQTPRADSHTGNRTFAIAGTGDTAFKSVDITLTSTNGGQDYQQDGIPIQQGGGWSTHITVEPDNYDLEACYSGQTGAGNCASENIDVP